MKNKNFLQATFPGIMLAAFLLTSCGTQDTQDTQALTMAETTQESSEQPEGSDTEEMADLTKRNDLEWEQRLDYTTERQAQLAEITVALEQDTEDVRQKAQGLLESMDAGNVDAAVDNVLAEDWYTVMLSDLLIGQRNYTGAAGSDGDWKMTILADELGQHCTAIEYPLGDGRMFYVQVTDSEIRYYVCASDHTGAFTSAALNLADGSLVSYEGTLSAANRPEGTLTIQMGAVDLSNGAAEAFHNRSAQATTYEGEFSSDGKPMITTPANLNKEGKTAYASAKSGRTTYYLTVASDGIEDAFTPTQFGISNIWE